MNGREHLLNLADAYCAARKIQRATLSTRLFNDGKRLDAIADGRDVLLGNYERAIRYFAANWPDGTAWPVGAPYPTPQAPRTERVA